jgi:hypothetical protein
MGGSRETVIRMTANNPMTETVAFLDKGYHLLDDVPEDIDYPRPDWHSNQDIDEQRNIGKL